VSHLIGGLGDGDKSRESKSREVECGESRDETTLTRRLRIALGKFLSLLPLTSHPTRPADPTYDALEVLLAAFCWRHYRCPSSSYSRPQVRCKLSRAIGADRPMVGLGLVMGNAEYHRCVPYGHQLCQVPRLIFIVYVGSSSCSDDACAQSFLDPTLSQYVIYKLTHPSCFLS
jgi:hypothetical protein